MSVSAMLPFFCDVWKSTSSHHHVKVFLWSIREHVFHFSAFCRCVPRAHRALRRRTLEVGMENGMCHARRQPHACPLSARDICVSSSSLFSTQEADTHVFGSRAPGKTTVDAAELLHCLSSLRSTSLIFTSLGSTRTSLR